jgi:hypothetical protein
MNRKIEQEIARFGKEGRKERKEERKEGRKERKEERKEGMSLGNTTAPRIKTPASGDK